MEYGGWTVLKELGVGGQGTVYLVRNPVVAQRLETILQELASALITQFGSNAVVKEPVKKLSDALSSHTRMHPDNWLVYKDPLDYEAFTGPLEKLAQALSIYSEITHPRNLGALKVVRTPREAAEAERAAGRFRLEVAVLQEITHPNVARLLDANVKDRWMVMEYYPRGTLADHLEEYKGNVRLALKAFRGIVEGVSRLHEKKAVHRDIKPGNIFVASDGRLVVGDLGIIFYGYDGGERLTRTYERVGPRDWMPPWGHTGKRLEDVKPSFDVFMLGKVLWSMISGQRFLPFWYWNREPYNLEKIFSDDPDMTLMNSILERCIVEEEKNCLPSASVLLGHVDDAVRILGLGGQILESGVARPCRVCGRGHYEAEIKNGGISFSGRPLYFDVFVCTCCGNAQIFRRTHP